MPSVGELCLVPGTELATGAGAAAAGAIDGDAHLDVVIAGEAGVQVYIGDGTGALSPTPALAGTSMGSEVGVGDFDDDGDLDVVVAHGFGAGSATIAWNVGGTLELGDPIAVAGAGGVAVGHVDPSSDGDDILLLAENGELWAYDGVGFAQSTTLTGPSYPSGGAIADFDNDTSGDALLTGAEGPCVASVFLGPWMGGLAALGDAAFANEYCRVDVADFDDDGVLDLLSRESGIPPGVALGVGDGTFGGLELIGAGGFIDSIAADVDGDAWPDIVSLREGDAAALEIRRSLGDGTFAEAETVELTGYAFYASDLPNVMAPGDWNADGITDLFITGFFGDGMSDVSLLVLSDP